MTTQSAYPSLPEEQSKSIEVQWEKALAYFRSRGTVIFMSGNCRFWERHAFVQQSLAELLVSHGIEVIWFDGIGWRPYHPVIRKRSPLLKVQQLFQLPGRRFSWVNKLNVKMTVSGLKRLIRKKGDPVIWVQSDFDEKVIAELPYVDIYSVFDDPRKHSPLGQLCRKAKTVFCQNSFTHRSMAKVLGEKAELCFPPLELHPEVFTDGGPVQLPRGFPRRIMGYIGSFISKGFDLALFEDFIRSFPDWGFLLMGRTDGEGMAFVNRFRKYSNFFYHPWVPREQIASAWKLIDVSLLLYRSYRPQDGAFAIKVLESVYFGAPCVGTQVPKTEDMGQFFPRSPFAETLKQEAIKVSSMNPEKVREIYQHFACEMNPKVYLTRVAASLSGEVSHDPRSKRVKV